MALDGTLAYQREEKRRLLDPDNGIALRTYYESLRAQMQGVRSLWDGRYWQLGAFFSPYSIHWDPSDTNNGARKDFEIINETGTLALRVLKAGLQNGLSDQTKEWFKIVVGGRRGRDLMKKKEVKIWCEDVADEVRRTMLKSNYYQTLLEAYGNEGLYGTCAFAILKDPKTDIRCHSYVTGQYWLGVDDTLRVDLSLRLLSYSPRMMVEQFGEDAVSSSVLTQYFSNAGGNEEQQNYTVVHVVHKGDYFGPRADGRPNPKWMSVWYDITTWNDQPQNKPQGLLRLEGFAENPVIVGRWDTIGENIYGESPAMDILGSTMSLQAWETRLAQAAEKGFDPPMVADAKCDPRRLTTLPGEFSFVDFHEGKPLFAPAYAIDFKIEPGLRMVERIEDRINRGLYRDVFQLFNEMDNKQPITAEEVRARAQERLMVLGPVVERNIEEVHAPSIQRILSILLQIPGRIPPVPAALKGTDGQMNVPMVLEFESILAQASRMGKINNIQTVLNIAGSEVAVAQGTMDNIDMDKTIQKVGELANIPSDLMRTMEDVTRRRKMQQQQQQQQQLMENAQGLAAAAQSASKTPAGQGTNLLQQVAPGLSGGDQ